MTTPGSTEQMIVTHDLARTFTSRKGDIEAVRGVDLSVGAGEIFGFLGPNGAGKTTTLRMLATLLPPTAGEATVAGADLRHEPQRVRERIGYVPQGGSTDPAETGRGELVLQGRLYGMDKAAAQLRAREVLAALDLEAAADRKIATYSGGMKRRLDVGLGIVNRPAVLFLDEPTTGLDPQARARMWDEIRRLRASRTTVFLTTHYLEGGRRARRPPRDHRPGPHRGRGHGRRAQAAGRRRRCDARRERGDRTGAPDRAHAAVRSRSQW